MKVLALLLVLAVSLVAAAERKVAVEDSVVAELLSEAEMEELEWERFFAEHEMSAEVRGFWADMKTKVTGWAADIKAKFKEQKCTICQTIVRFVRESGCSTMKEKICAGVTRLVEEATAAFTGPAATLIGKTVDLVCPFIWDGLFAAKCEDFMATKARGSAWWKCVGWGFCPIATKVTEIKYLLPDTCLTDSGVTKKTNNAGSTWEERPAKPASTYGDVDEMLAVEVASSKAAVALEAAMLHGAKFTSTKNTKIAIRKSRQVAASGVVAKFHISNTATVAGGLNLDQRRALAEFMISSEEHVSARGWALALLAQDLGKAHDMAPQVVLAELEKLGSKGFIDWVKSAFTSVGNKIKEGVEKVLKSKAVQDLIAKAKDALCQGCQSIVREIYGYGCNKIKDVACSMACTGLARVLKLAGVTIPLFQEACGLLCSPLAEGLAEKCEEIKKEVKGDFSAVAFCKTFPLQPTFTLCGATATAIADECSNDVWFGAAAEFGSF